MRVQNVRKSKHQDLRNYGIYCLGKVGLVCEEDWKRGTREKRGKPADCIFMEKIKNFKKELNHVHAAKNQEK